MYITFDVVCAFVVDDFVDGSLVWKVAAWRWCLVVGSVVCYRSCEVVYHVVKITFQERVIVFVSNIAEVIVVNYQLVRLLYELLQLIYKVRTVV